MLLLYNISVKLYVAGIRLAAKWNPKAKEWIRGRKDVFHHLEEKILPGRQYVWFHCSSAGEFEQAKPVIEKMKTSFPGLGVVISFFSPSGFSVAKNYAHADVITYLPIDTRANAKRFINTVRPVLVVFVKYEFWYHHLSAAAFQHIPLLLISAVFRKSQVFFKTHGSFFRNMLFLFRQIFVQDQPSADLLTTVNISHCLVAGDTRFDRVAGFKENADLPVSLTNYCGSKKLLIAGSTWPDDEDLLKELRQSMPGNSVLVIVPHHVNEAHIKSIQSKFPGAVLYSELEENKQPTGVLIVDTIGLLSKLYSAAHLTYVGGGFTRDGIHNILEPAAWGKPVFFGPNYKKYREAKEMIGQGAAFSIKNHSELGSIISQLWNDPEKYQAAANAAKNYVSSNTGASERIVKWIQEKRLLTNW